MRREAFGVTKKGESAWLYSLENRQGLKAQVTDYGAALVRMMGRQDAGCGAWIRGRVGI